MREEFLGSLNNIGVVQEILGKVEGKFCKWRVSTGFYNVEKTGMSFFDLEGRREMEYGRPRAEDGTEYGVPILANEPAIGYLGRS